MSFAYMPVYTGDYLRDTRHLTPAKHGIYLLLLMHCWDHAGPVPLDEQEAAGIANCRSADEIESLRYVLGRFFTRMEDGWYNKRVMEEIERWNAISNKRAGAARARWSARKKIKEIDEATKSTSNANALQVQSTSNAPGPSLSPSPSPAPGTTTTKPKARSRPASAPEPQVDLPPWLNANDWQAFLAHRINIRKPMNAEAQRRAVIRLGRFRREGHDPNKVLDLSIVNGWQGLFTDNETKAGQDLGALIAELTAKGK